MRAIALMPRKSGKLAAAAQAVKETPGAILVTASETSKAAIMRDHGVPGEQVCVLPVQDSLSWGGALARCRWPM